MKVLEGKLVAEGIKIGIVAARFNEFIVSKLLGGAKDCLTRHGVEDDNITVAWVPGAFEIPLIADKMAKTNKYDAIICLGTVIRGQTSHYDYVCNEVSKGIATVGLQTGVPVLFGLFVIILSDLTPKSFNICAPTQYSLKSGANPSFSFASTVS